MRTEFVKESLFSLYVFINSFVLIQVIMRDIADLCNRKMQRRASVAARLVRAESGCQEGFQHRLVIE